VKGSYILFLHTVVIYFTLFKPNHQITTKKKIKSAPEDPMEVETCQAFNECKIGSHNGIVVFEQQLQLVNCSFNT
jgi:hypothetical protein